MRQPGAEQHSLRCPTHSAARPSISSACAVQDMTICYDERGAKYSLPRYVLSAPQNLSRGSRGGAKRVSSGSCVEVLAGGAGASMEMAR